jgi:short-subunit dehydrogenase
MRRKLFCFFSTLIVSFISMHEIKAEITIYEKKKVIIIGASSGIGRELASIFIKNGYLVGALSRNEAKLKAAQKELGENFLYELGDIQKDESIERVKTLLSQLGGCDIFILNAGIWDDARQDLHTKEVLDTLDWKKLLIDQQNVIATNVAGFTRMANFALEYFVQQKQGHFVGISSLDAVRGTPWAPTYSASKAFESTFMQGWRSTFEMAELPIYITDIRPGFIATYPLTEGMFWVEPLDVAGQEIFKAIQTKEKIAYITKRWEKFAHYLLTVPDATYNFLASNFGIKSLSIDFEKKTCNKKGI